MGPDELISYLLSPAAIIGLIIGLAEIFKMYFGTKYIPAVDLVLGITFGVCIYGFVFQYGIAKGFMIGLALGLSACGLFSGIKNTSIQRGA